MAATVLGKGLLRNAARGRCRIARGLVSDGRQTAASVSRSRGRTVGAALRVGATILNGGLLCGLLCGTTLLIFGLAGSLLFLLALLPFLADFLEFYSQTALASF